MSVTVALPQSMPNGYLKIGDLAGGPGVQLPVTVDARGYLNITGLTVDTVNIAQNDVLLSSTPSVNLNTATETVLFRMTAPYTVCYITRVCIRLASTSLTTASYGFGWNAGTDTDVIASATHTELTTNAKATILSPIVGQAVGAANGQFAVKCTILQGGAATVTIDTWGCLF